jgi:hypothetical protein
MDYRGRLLNVLQTSRASFPTIPSIGSFPTGSFTTDGTDGILATVTHILWMLLFIFIVFLVLIIINYTVYPIINFGNNPNALITVPQTQWVNSWPSCPATGCVETKSTNTMATANYSLLFDVKITNPAPSTTTSNTFVLLYKTPSPTPLTSFVNLGSVATPDPSLIVAYDSLASKIIVYLTTQMNGIAALQVVSSECIPSVPYRIGIVVSSSLVELYMNGSYMSSKSFGGKTVAGTDKDYIYSTPNTYSKNVQVANLFTANYVVSSGEIKSMGGPALTA